MMDGEWDVAISRSSTRDGSIQATIPAAIARAIRAKGYNRAKLRLTDEGILLTPYIDDVQRRSAHQETVTLPETWND